MNREPIYKEPFRIVSRPNGLWRVEKRGSRPEEERRTVDLWNPRTRDIEFDAAMHLLNAYSQQQNQKVAS